MTEQLRLDTQSELGLQTEALNAIDLALIREFGERADVIFKCNLAEIKDTRSKQQDAIKADAYRTALTWAESHSRHCK